MKRLILLPIIGLLFFSSCKQTANTNQSAENPIILEVGNESVSTKEFAHIYKKNNQKKENAYTEDSITSYLDLYTNFKLKVLEARALGLDTQKAFVDELAGYKKQLAKPYLTEKKVTEKLLQEAYDRQKQYIHASHILLLVDPYASPVDTLKAFKKISKIRNEANSKDFGDLAMQYSEDPSSRMKGKLGYKGNLDYFTSLNMVYEFENAAFETKVGEISQPFRTQFGYHIIKVHDKKEVKGKVKVAHIMINIGRGVNKEDSTLARNRINEIYKKAMAGEDWNKLCLQFSEHVKTKNKGGVLSPFAFRRELGYPEFENMAFSLKKDEISKPVRTPHGWHIIKFIESVDFPSFEKVKPNLEKSVAKDSRSKLSQNAFYNRLKEENEFVESAQNQSVAFGVIDEKIVKNQWKHDENHANGTDTLELFTIKDRSYTIASFHHFAEDNQRSIKSNSRNQKVRILYEQFVNKSLYDYEEEMLPTKYFAYKMLINEYEEGMLLFQLMSDKVWNKALKDTTGLRKFYEENKKNHQWKERADVKIYDVDSKETLESLKTTLSEDTLTKRQLLRKFNTTSTLTLNIKEKKYEKGQNELLNDIEWKKGTYTIKKNSRIYYIIVDEILPPSTKELKEIKGLMISAYQSQLEDEWLKTLRKKYDIKVFKEEVKKLVK
ncbi:MAG: peptidylprolyl isomerase [Cytophagales bacterium]|nr:peptidylprolyl isomerase [Cytophagales bacterium]